ncbi:MAG: citrate/2-methylcitrate synthase [Acutalibacteraceae bacterium]
MAENKYHEITKEIIDLAKICSANSTIDPSLYEEHHVNRGLRDLHGNGVITGLTEISTITSFRYENGEKIPCKGELRYRGININDIVNGFIKDDRFGFEETVYLLLFGKLPNKDELEDFCRILSDYRTLPTNFVRDVIMKAPNKDIMNSLAKSVLTLSSYDENANDISLPNVLRQCIQLIANFSQLSVYAYQVYRHYDLNKGLYIHRPDPALSTAENILRLLRSDKKFSPLEAKLLDLSLVLHAEHGGGNNSTFTTHVVTSSGTDTYSSVAASLCSLKGPKHGGANIKVKRMFEDIKKNVSNWSDDGEIKDYLVKILNKEAFDKSGLIYGMGHAVYSVSDPRAEIFKNFAQKLSEEKGKQKEFELYNSVARIATEVIAEKRHIYKGVSPNIDFYSGFAYSMMNIPEELFTPMFAVARIAGWSAHRLEELINAGKIIRPAYKAVAQQTDYIPINDR